MKKRKKGFSGMTLLEIIVSLAVVSVMTLVLVRASSSINSYMRSANNVDRKIAQQAPKAEVKHKESAHSLNDNVTIKLEANGKVANVYGSTYSMVDPGTVSHDRPGDNLNMKFVILRDVTTTGASATPTPPTVVTPAGP